MKLLAVVAGAILSLALTVTQAEAARTFAFSFSGAGVSGSGRLTTADAGSPYQITGITGTINGDAITGLSGYAAADNLLYYPTQPFVDFSGLSFTTASLGDWGMGWTGSAYGITDSISNPSGACCGITPLSLTVTAVPEPATWAMMLLGVGAMGFAMRSRRRLALAAA